MARSWTTEQQAAITHLDRDVCVAAGAGSGKTGVLIERIVRIVRESAAGALPPDQRSGIDEMLVITFTDKAAREMKARLVSEFSRQNMQDERRKVETAYISTIHAFCSRLLKENPFEAGVSPDFTVTIGAEASRLKREAFDRTLEAAFALENRDTVELVQQLQGEGALRRGGGPATDGLCDEVWRLVGALQSAGRRLEDVQGAWNAGAGASLVRSLDPVRALLNPVLEEVRACRHRIGSVRMVGSAACDALRTALNAEADSLEPLADADPLDRVIAAKDALGRVAVALRAQNSRLRGPQGADPDLQSAVARLRLALDAAGDSPVDRNREADAAAICHRVWGLAAAAWTEYDTAKRALGVLDGADLQSEAVRLLETSPGVLRRYRRRFRYVLVDEFQDTDPLQMRLVGLLHGTVGPPAEPPLANRLFIVGDVQQSIYGFRNADPGIFREQSRRFRDAGAGHYVTMATNFRSRPEIIGYVNGLFDRVWGHGAEPHTPSTPGATHAPKAGPSVECMVIRARPRSGYPRGEAAALAQRISAMVRDREVRITHQGDPRCGEPVRYGDIAVLLRVFTNIEDYERAFAAAGVPYFVVGGGQGYYARMEIRDVANVLKALDTPLDDLAVASVLRSPMVGLDADTLLALAMAARSDRARTGGRLYPAIPALLQSGTLRGDQAEALGAFHAMADRLRADLDRIPVGQLLERILAQTQYDARLLVRPNGPRRLANVRKLLQMALDRPEERVPEFVRRLVDLTTLSEREGDAPTEEEASDVVRFITVHRAKGLEFPVVFVADLSRLPPMGGREVFLADPARMALGCKVGGYASVTYAALEQMRRSASEAESARTLYVALTRAREHLVMCGATEPGSHGGAWSDIVFANSGVMYGDQPVTITGPGGAAMRVAPMGSGAPAGGARGPAAP